MADERSPFDVIVIGAGPAGEVVAGRCADGGLQVAIIERELIGGECSYWGCMPSKALLRPGDVLAATRRAPGASAAITGTIDLGAALSFRDEMAHHWDDGAQLPWLQKKGVTLLRGRGRLDGVRSVVVTDADGHDQRLVATRAVVLATGTRAKVPPIDGLRELAPWDNRAATSATAIPDRLLVLGGGAIGCELALAFRRLGASAVTIVEAAERLLVNEEPFVSDDLVAAFGDEGIVVELGAEASSARRSDDGVVHLTLADGRVVEGDEILVAIGRRPATDELGLEVIGLEPGAPVEVDEHLRATGVPGGWLYAVGDVNGRALLTHMGKYQGRVAGTVITEGAGPDRDPGVDLADDAMVPRVVFTDPRVAAVGLTERQARERGIDVGLATFPMGDTAGAAVLGHGIGGHAQLVIDRARQVVVGATFTGPESVQELLHSATVAVAGEVPLDRLRHAVPSYPTLSEVWLRLLETYRG